jgi:menaquinone-dependent protoporphyrinogen IX oxidase
MDSILLVVESKRGSARLAAEWIANGLPDVTVVDLKSDKIYDISPYSKVVIGTGILAGQAYGKVKLFIKQFRQELLSKQLYLFITHLFEGEGIEADFQSAFDAEILEHASHRAGVGGKLRLAEVNFLMRSFVKKIGDEHGMDLTNRDTMRREACDEFAKVVIQ